MPNIVRLEPNPKMLEFLKRASDNVAKMPAWQRGNLEASMRSTNSTPRPPVLYDAQTDDNGVNIQ